MPAIAVLPTRIRPWLADVVAGAGATLVAPDEAEALVWTSIGDADELRAVLDGNPGIRWVQLPWAGVENFADVLDDDRIWTCGKGVYARPVAEHALMLALAGLRGMATYARAAEWSEPEGVNLVDARVTIVGGGGIAEELVGLLGSFGVEITVVRRSPEPMAGVAEVVPPDRIDEALPGRKAVFLALPLVPETVGLFDEARLRRLDADAWLVNVARGGHIVTDDLVAVLREGAIGGAALDVTDPEPLPAGHPLWELALITPHIANTPEMATPLLSARIAANVGRFAAGQPLLGLVDAGAGY